MRWCDTKTDGAWEIPCNNVAKANCNQSNLRNGKEVWINILGRDVNNNQISSAPTIDISASSLANYTSDGGNCYQYPVTASVTGAQICFEVAYALDKNIYQPAGVWSSSYAQWQYGACMSNTSCPVSGVCYTSSGQNIGQSCNSSSDCALKGCSSCFCKF